MKKLDASVRAARKILSLDFTDPINRAIAVDARKLSEARIGLPVGFIELLEQKLKAGEL